MQECDIRRVLEQDEADDLRPFQGMINGLVLSSLIWVPFLAYLFRKPILRFFGVNS
jgi:hypothetical protein